MNRPTNKATSAKAGNSGLAGSEHTTQSGGQSSRRSNHNTTTGGGVSSRTPARSVSGANSYAGPARFRLADDRAPWRVQIQIFGTILLALVVVAVVALFYLNVSAKTAALGRKIQFYTVRLDGPHRVSADDPEGTIIPIEEIDIRIAGLRARLAELTSLERVERRAQELGFKSLDAEAIIYLQIPGYQPRDAVQLAPEPAAQVAVVSTLLPAYRSSLVDELAQGWDRMVDSVMAAVISASDPAVEAQP